MKHGIVEVNGFFLYEQSDKWRWSWYHQWHRKRQYRVSLCTGRGRVEEVDNENASGSFTALLEYVHLDILYSRCIKLTCAWISVLWPQ